MSGKRPMVSSDMQSLKFNTKIILNIAPPRFPFFNFKTTLLVSFCNLVEVANAQHSLLIAESCLLAKNLHVRYSRYYRMHLVIYLMVTVKNTNFKE